MNELRKLQNLMFGPLYVYRFVLQEKQDRNMMLDDNTELIRELFGVVVECAQTFSVRLDIHWQREQQT